jgi:hypothetical protein
MLTKTFHIVVIPHVEYLQPVMFSALGFMENTLKRCCEVFSLMRAKVKSDVLNFLKR